MTRLLIIGAGPAGLAAAIAAAERGASATILEKKELPGRKLLLTGGGRCNLVDPRIDPLDALDAFGRAGRFYRDAFAAFDPPAFFGALGIEIVRDPSTGMLHVKGGARRMLDALLAATDEAGVDIRSGCRVLDVKRAQPSGFDVTFLRSSEDKAEMLRAQKLIIATGGITWPQTGSSGDAYAWLEALGHRIAPPRPALGALATDPCFDALAGQSVADVELTLLAGAKRAGVRRGILLFTHRGISGPAPLDLSLDAARLKRDAALEVVVDLLPDITAEKLLTWFSRRGSRRAAKVFEGAPFDGPFSARMISTMLELAKIDPSAHLDHLGHQHFRAFVDALKKLKLRVLGMENPEQAIVTLGGVSTKGIDPRKMQSRIVEGLYIAGELIDPAGTCGGYNLLQAFATGWLAGSSA